MLKMRKLTEKDVDTKAKQAKALNSLRKALASEPDSKLSGQLIACNLATIAGSNHETSVSDAVLSNLHAYFISNVALWYEETWNHVYYDDSNDSDRQVLPELKAKMNYCRRHHIDPNDYWVTTDDNGDVQPVDTTSLSFVVTSAELA